MDVSKDPDTLRAAGRAPPAAVHVALPVETMLWTRGQREGGKLTCPSQEASFPGDGGEPSKVFGAGRCSYSCLREAFRNVPGLSKAKGVSSNDFLSSCIIILL